MALTALLNVLGATDAGAVPAAQLLQGGIAHALAALLQHLHADIRQHALLVTSAAAQIIPTGMNTASMVIRNRRLSSVPFDGSSTTKKIAAPNSQTSDSATAVTSMPVTCGPRLRS